MCLTLEKKEEKKMLVTEKSNFTRGDKASVSVRLRSKKVVSEAAKKKNRHSGDFSFFKHNNQNTTSLSNGFEDETDGKKEGGDWAYITFQNGVPTVQDIKTNVGPVSAKEPVVGGHQHVVVNGATPIPRPVKVINHMQPPHPPPIWQPQNKRMSGDFSMFATQATPMHYQQAPPITRQATPAALAMRQQQSPNRRSPKKASPAVNNVQPRPNVMYRRRSDQNGGHGGVALHAGVSKRCSGEFDFSHRQQNRRSSSDYSLLMQSQVSAATPYEKNESKAATPPSVVRVQVNYPKNEQQQRPKSMIFNGSSGSPDIVRGTPIKEEQLMPRPQGLGRRSVTQINIKRNSYSSAMCKSQENLVKVSLIFLRFGNFLIALYQDLELANFRAKHEELNFD